MLLLLQLQKVASNMHSSITPIILTRFMPAKMLVEAETTNWPGQFWLAFFTQLLVGGWFGVVLRFPSIVDAKENAKTLPLLQKNISSNSLNNSLH
jgi:hypothetical protein